jgi:hypothetical protein
MHLKIILVTAIFVACTFLFPHNAFSQQQNQTSHTVSGNISKTVVNVPSNASRIEITLKNDQSSQYTISVIYAVIPAVIGVMGTIIAVYLTHQHSRKLEHLKTEIARQQQQELEADFRNKVSYDLGLILELLNTLQSSSLDTYDQEAHDFVNPKIRFIDALDMQELLRRLPEESKDVPLERKLRALGGPALAKVDTAYRSISELVSYLEKAEKKFSGILFDESKVNRTRSMIQDALLSLR